MSSVVVIEQSRDRVGHCTDGHRNDAGDRELRRLGGEDPLDSRPGARASRSTRPAGPASVARSGPPTCSVMIRPRAASAATTGGTQPGSMSASNARDGDLVGEHLRDGLRPHAATIRLEARGESACPRAHDRRLAPSLDADGGQPAVDPRGQFSEGAAAWPPRASPSSNARPSDTAKLYLGAE